MQISDYDLRQYSRMIQVIDEFLVDKVSLRELVSTLSFLLTNLEEVSGNWRNAFQENQVYSHDANWNAQQHRVKRRFSKTEIVHIL